jgi:cyclase
VIRDRVSDNIYAFVSDLYYEVTAGFIATPEGAVVIDTLPFPSETLELKKAALKECPEGIKYLILTHYHADHTLGSYLLESAEIIAHKRTRTFLAREGAQRLAEIKSLHPELENASIILPSITFTGAMNLSVGGLNLYLFELFGHSHDSIAVYVQEEKTLFAGDLLMPIPLVADGDVDLTIASLEALKNFNLEYVVQGHGGVLLKGEIMDMIDDNIRYLQRLKAKVAEAVSKKRSPESLFKIKMEEFGKSPLAIGAMGEPVHKANILAIYEAMKRGQH